MTFLIIVLASKFPIRTNSFEFLGCLSTGIISMILRVIDGTKFPIDTIENSRIINLANKMVVMRDEV